IPVETDATPGEPETDDASAANENENAESNDMDGASENVETNEANDASENAGPNDAAPEN
ncbi:MAG: hypothetical protein HUK22_09020, partial [Thermoguttaceae bacterium]|nr:hypothetical protein [Thermoguttaceae bacterium]